MPAGRVRDDASPEVAEAWAYRARPGRSESSSPQLKLTLKIGETSPEIGAPTLILRLLPLVMGKRIDPRSIVKFVWNWSVRLSGAFPNRNSIPVDRFNSSSPMKRDSSTPAPPSAAYEISGELFARGGAPITDQGRRAAASTMPGAVEATGH